MSITVAQLGVKVSADGADETKAKLKGVSDQTDATGETLKRFAGAAIVFEAVKGAGELLFEQIKGIAEATGHHQAVQAQLQAVLKSTGDISGVTAEQVNKLSDSLSQSTTYSADSVTATQNLLLTFQGIGKDVMPGATKAVLDMSTALGQDTKESAIQLGKALDDPTKGIVALHRVGVDFNEAQKKLIKGYLEHGEKAKAQSVILQELQHEFGGSAVAAGKTLPGQLAILHNKFEELQIKIGTAVAPVIQELVQKHLLPLASVLSEKVGWAIDHAKQLFDQFGPEIAIVAGAIGGLLVAALFAAAAAAWAFVAPILIAAAPFIAVGAAIALLVIGLKYAYDHFTWFHQAVDVAVGTVKLFAIELRDRLGPAVHNVFEFIKVALGVLQTVWNAVWPAMQAVLAGFWDIIRGEVEIAWSVISGIFKVALDLLGGNWKQAWNDLKEMVGGVFDGILHVVTGYLKVMAGLVLSFVEEMLGLIGKIPGPIGDMARSALGAVQGIAKQLAKAGEDAGSAYAGGLASTQSIVADAAYRLTIASVPGAVHRHAMGTLNAPGGLSLVGENGPELLNLPQGAQVFPLQGGGSSSGVNLGGGTQHIIIQLDRRTLAEAVVREMPSVVRLGTGLAV